MKPLKVVVLQYYLEVGHIESWREAEAFRLLRRGISYRICAGVFGGERGEVLGLGVGRSDKALR